MNGKRARDLRSICRVNADGSVNAHQYKQLKKNRKQIALAACIGAPLTERRRKPKAAIKPTWPATENQEAQSRPVIVERPLRALREKLLAATPRAKDGTRTLSGKDRAFLRYVATQPKHVIAAAALAA